ncbi:regulation of response to stimulus [Branchiostoma belcheri]|nr:regulation of response to stimulus [Branchiostoma belcheri]
MALTTRQPKIKTTRRQWCCSLGDQQGHLAGANSTPPNRTSQQSAEQQYSEIPDEYYDQQNTATSTTSQTDHDYSQIPDDYFNYYNTRPGAQHQDDKDYSVRFNTAAAEVVVPSSTRLGDKHPSYDTAPQVWRDPQNYQIPAQGRRTNIKTHRMPETGNSGHQYMGLLGNCRHNRRPLSYSQALRVPQDDKDYSVRFNTATAEVVVPSSTRLGCKHPSYNTAPQVWRDPQNYQIPAQGHVRSAQSTSLHSQLNTQQSQITQTCHVNRLQKGPWPLPFLKVMHWHGLSVVAKVKFTGPKC